MPVKLTDELAKAEAPPPSGNKVVRDTEVKGLGLRITAAGARTFVLEYELRGVSRRFSIGDADTFTVGRARKVARDLRAQVRLGHDPQAERNAARAQASAPKPDSLAVVVEDFLTRGLEKKARAASYVAGTRALFANHIVPRLGSKALAEITRRDVIAALDGIAEAGTVRVVEGRKLHAAGGPISANRALAALRALYSWAIRRSLTEANPCLSIERPGQETARERTLTAEEIREVWAACDVVAGPWGAYIKMLLLTGQRRSEVAGMKWSAVDFGEATWTLAGDEVKNGHLHLVPLAPAALELLKTMPRKGDWVFSTNGRAPVSGFAKAKALIDREILAARRKLDPEAEAMPAWTLHDVRRSVATNLGRLGTPGPIISRVLNHVQAGVTAKHYDRHSYLPEKRHALDAWAAALARIVAPPGANVIELAAARG